MDAKESGIGNSEENSGKGTKRKEAPGIGSREGGRGGPMSQKEGKESV